MTDTIPVFRPSVGEEEIAAVTEVLRSGWWGLGPKTAEFEKRFAEYIGAEHCVGTNSATAALHLGLKVLDVEGGEVLTTSMTFASTYHAILYNDAIPVFCDIEPDTLNIDVTDMAGRFCRGRRRSWPYIMVVTRATWTGFTPWPTSTESLSSRTLRMPAARSTRVAR